MKQRYEVWFLRCGLADGSGAWWFRYLIMCHIAENGIEEGRCWGNLQVDGHNISWKLQIASQFGFVLSYKGWIGFSKSPHSDATFSGEIQFDGQIFSGDPLGFGVQGHNCGYRHRSYWRWMQAYFPNPGGQASTIEALIYDLPLGLTFRKLVLWQGGKLAVLRKITEREVLREDDRLRWVIDGMADNGVHIEGALEGNAPGIHRLTYTKTDGTGTFPVANASLARATLKLETAGTRRTLETDTGAVLEMGGV